MSKHWRRSSQTNSILQSQDAFGHQVALNFNRNGTVLKTALGGSITLLIKLIILGLLAFQTWQIIHGSKTMHSTGVQLPANFTEIGQQSFKDAKVLPYIIIKRLSDQMPLEYDQSHFSKIVKMSWVSSQHQGDGKVSPRDFVH